MIIKSAGIGSEVEALEGTLSDKYKKAPLGQDLISGRIIGNVFGVTTAVGTASISTYAILKKWMSLKGKDGKIYLSNLLVNISTIMWNMFKYYFMNNLPTQPAIVLASIPLGTVTEVSHAMSQRDLKFRAVGGVFLADQEGGEESLRIVGKAWGKNRFMFLNMLDVLFLYGSAKTVDLFADFLKNPMSQIEGLPALDVSDLPKTISPWHDFNTNACQEGTADFRLTFPVITRARIYTNMFIETYEYTESVENGIDVVEYVIFLRKYIPPPPQKFGLVIKPKGSDFEAKWYYKADSTDKLYRFVDRIDMWLSYGFSTAMILYRTAIFLSSGKFSYMENLISRFGIALNRTVEGNVDIKRHYSDEWAVGEKEKLFGYTPCEKYSGDAYKICMSEEWT